jgi:hypothetical protein
MSIGTPPAISDLAGLSEPFCKLIEATRAGLGVMYEPRRIRNRALAERDASIIKATGEKEAMIILEEGSGPLVVPRDVVNLAR